MRRSHISKDDKWRFEIGFLRSHHAILGVISKGDYALHNFIIAARWAAFLIEHVWQGINEWRGDHPTRFECKIT